MSLNLITVLSEVAKFSPSFSSVTYRWITFCIWNCSEPAQDEKKIKRKKKKPRKLSPEFRSQTHFRNVNLSAAHPFFLLRKRQKVGPIFFFPRNILGNDAEKVSDCRDSL